MQGQEDQPPKQQEADEAPNQIISTQHDRFLGGQWHEVKIDHAGGPNPHCIFGGRHEVIL
jgi:hypothetical protein